MIDFVRQRMGGGADLDEVLDPEDAVIVERLKLEFHQRPLDSAVAGHVATLQNVANEPGQRSGLDRSMLVRLTASAAVIVIGLVGLLVALPEAPPDKLQADLATEAQRSTSPGSIYSGGRAPEYEGSEPAIGARADDITESEQGSGQEGDGGPVGDESPSATTSGDNGADSDEAPGNPGTSPTSGVAVTSGSVAASGGQATSSSGGGQATTTVAGRATTAQPTTTAVPSSSPAPNPPSTKTLQPPKQETCNGRVATIVGTSKSDVLQGTAGNDVIYGGSGNDVIYGLGGNDTICGGNGKDELHGGSGDDYLYGGNGKDLLIGGAGTDILDGGNGPDELIPD